MKKKSQNKKENELKSFSKVNGNDTTVKPLKNVNVQNNPMSKLILFTHY